MLAPDARFKKITQIKFEFLKEYKIKGLIIDVDNTLMDLDQKPLEGIKKWVDDLKEKDIKFCIASNSIKKEKLERVSKELEIPYVYISLKPLGRGLKKARKILNLESKHIGEIGDQLFTDVWGAKRLKMFSILTDPIGPEKHIISEFKRKIERKFLKRMEDKYVH